MDNLSIFKGISLSDIDMMIHCFNARIISFKKDRTICSNVINTSLIGVILKGSADMVKYDYYGNRIILEKLEYDSVFGEIFSYMSSDISIVSTSDTEVLFIEYSEVIKRCKKSCICHSKFVDNLFRLMSQKVLLLNSRIELISKRTIRDKLLGYFNILVKGKVKRSFIIPYTLTDLADYLSVDRSAMTRELKNLEDEGFISRNGKKITLNY